MRLIALISFLMFVNEFTASRDMKKARVRGILHHVAAGIGAMAGISLLVNPSAVFFVWCSFLFGATSTVLFSWKVVDLVLAEENWCKSLAVWAVLAGLYIVVSVINYHRLFT